MTSTAPPTGRERGHRRVTLDQDGDTDRTDEEPDDHAGDEPAPAHPVGVGPEQRHDVLVDERLLGLSGVAPDQDDHADGQEGRPSEETDERDVQRGRDELHRDQQRDEDGGDRPDAAAVADGAGVDVVGLPLHRDQQPGHGVDEHHHAAGDRQQDEADAHPHGVDPRLARDGPADATQDAVVGATAQGTQSPPDMVVTVVIATRTGAHGGRGTTRSFVRTSAGRPTSPRAGTARPRARRATAQSGGHRR